MSVMNHTTSTAGVNISFDPPVDSSELSHDWVSPATRRVLAGEATDRRGIILAAQELAWNCAELTGFAHADFLYSLLMASAAKSGVPPTYAYGSDELTGICREVERCFVPPGKPCPRCGASQDGHRIGESPSLDKLLPELAHLAVAPADRTKPATKPGKVARQEELEKATAASWFDDEEEDGTW
jgi:hypothetical protein